MGEISKLLTERTQGAFPNNTETNPKVITLRSGKELEQSREVGKQASDEDTSVPKDQDATIPIQ